MSKSTWDVQNIPSQSGKVVVITGATSGLGKEASKVLASKGATIILAVRNTKKAEGVTHEIIKQFPDSKLDIKKLELNSLKSIQSFSEAIKSNHDRLDILINNAGVMACPFSKTVDGFEIQMGVNHLGHFALTGHLMPLLKKTSDARIVATSSIAHKQGNINFNDINWAKRKYKTSQAYCDSKIANLYFAFELVKKLKGQNDAPIVTIAHPGWTTTELQRHASIFRILNPVFSQKVDQGVLPTLRAAIDPNASSGDFYGPAGFMEMKGHPIKVTPNKRSRDESKAKQLWKISEEMTGVIY